jgi:subtilisin family serine protease
MPRARPTSAVAAAPLAVLTLIGLLAVGAGPVAAESRADARERLGALLGSDWSEVLVVVAPEELPGLLKRRGGSWRARGLGVEVLRPPSKKDPVEWYADLLVDPAVHGAVPNYNAYHPGCRQLSIDILEIVGRVDLTTQEALAGQQPVPATGATVAIVDAEVVAIDLLEGRLLPPLDALRGAGAVASAEEIEEAEEAVEAVEAEAPGWAAGGHGTAMASLVASFAPGARILPVRVVRGNCRTTLFDVARGIELAADAGADVISVGVGSPRTSPVLELSVHLAQAAGALVVAPAGNAGVVEYPAALPGVIAVTAVDRSGVPAWFAPVGEGVDLAAPGIDVLAIGPQESVLLVSGTSPAAALVAAGAAAVAARSPLSSWQQQREELLLATAPIVTTDDPTLAGAVGAGVLELGTLD